MNITGPRSLLPSSAPAGQEPGLRPFQKVTAQILAVTGNTALLVLEGHPVVAQLTSAEQAASLLTQQTAQFLVTQLGDQKITLKLLRNDEPQAAPAESALHRPEVALRLLQQHNLPASDENLMLARSALKQRLWVTPDLLNEMQQALSEYGRWGSAEADLAAMLKAAGLPVNAESLRLAARPAAQTGDAVARLITMLSELTKQGLPAELLKQLDSSLQALNATVLRADGEVSPLAEQLRAAVELLGRSMENRLLEQSQNPGAQALERSLAALARLQQMLQQEGKTAPAEAAGAFLEDLRQQQFLNAGPGADPGREGWLETGFALSAGQPGTEEDFSAVRLRITREPRQDSHKNGANTTRLILRVDVSPGETVEVDLAVTGKHIQTSVTAPDPAWRRQAESEFPSLEQALQQLGFTLVEGRISAGNPRPLERLQTASGSMPLLTVNIEV
jgi:hypothetical protein